MLHCFISCRGPPPLSCRSSLQATCSRAKSTGPFPPHSLICRHITGTSAAPPENTFAPLHSRPPIYRMKRTENRVEVRVLKIQERGSSSSSLGKNSSVLLPPLSALLVQLQGCCLFVCKIKLELCITHKGFPITGFFNKRLALL